MIKLYGVPGSRAFRSLWMLEELGLDYENVPVNFATGDTRKPDYLKINPNGHIPALDDDGVVLFESLAINLYLARKYGKDLWPGTVEDEGRAFQWTLWAMTEAEEPLLTAMFHRLLYPEKQRDPARADDAARRFEAPLAVLDAALADRDYLLGGDFSVADLNVASVVSWTKLAKIDISGSEHAAAWLARCTSRPAVKRAQGR
ncbi:MAG: glutathione S-transferase family protein [Deltaproteobacteria bacterium]|nr:MAG: glutathione S-transferase family protein [Deltaproteobacteria bacterium]